MLIHVIDSEGEAAWINPETITFILTLEDGMARVYFRDTAEGLEISAAGRDKLLQNVTVV
jgi:hypothetical protein